MSKNLSRADSTGIDPAVLSAALSSSELAMVVALLRRINHACDLHSKYLVRSSGLSAPQLVVMKTIRDLGEVTASRVASACSLSQGTVSLILDRLEERGLIERYRSSRDRRIVHARLTSRGTAAVDAALPLLGESFVTRFAGLVPDEQNRIIAALQTVATMMEDADPID